jgi:hypothetical protein
VDIIDTMVKLAGHGGEVNHQLELMKIADRREDILEALT